MSEPISDEKLERIAENSKVCYPIMTQVCTELLAARKRVAFLEEARTAGFAARDELEAKCAELETEAKKYGEWKCCLETYKDQWKRHYEKLIADFEAEKQAWFAKHLNEEADDLRAPVAELESKHRATISHLEGPFCVNITEPGTYQVMLKVFPDGSFMREVKAIKPNQECYPNIEWVQWHKEREHIHAKSNPPTL